MRIMAIDDEPGILEVLERLLRSRGYEILSYTNSKDASRDIDNGILEGIDLVLLDLRMPRVDGRAILKKVKTRSDIPVLILTGSLQASMVRELGADGVMFKPVDMEELLEKIKEMLGRPI